MKQIDGQGFTIAQSLTNTIHRANVGLMLVQRRGRVINIKPTLGYVPHYSEQLRASAIYVITGCLRKRLIFAFDC